MTANQGVLAAIGLFQGFVAPAVIVGLASELERSAERLLGSELRPLLRKAFVIVSYPAIVSCYFAVPFAWIAFVGRDPMAYRELGRDWLLSFLVAIFAFYLFSQVERSLSKQKPRGK